MDLSPAWQPQGFTIMAKPRGPICNLNCSHCYYLSKENLYPGSEFRMTDELLEEYTKQYIQAQRTPEINFVWQGGEPILMGLDFYRKALEYQRKYVRPGIKVMNSFQTNGTLITEEWAKFFRENDFLIGISIDGPAEIHNHFRVDKQGKPTYQRVIEGLRHLQAQEVEYNLLTCVSVNNADRGKEVYQFFRDELGAKFVQFIPIIERENETGFQEGGHLTRRSISPKQYANFLIEVFNEWIRYDVGQMFVQIFDTTLASWVGEHPGLCIFEETCGLGLVLEHNGDVYSCDHFVEPKHLLGNMKETSLREMVNSQHQYDFAMAKKTSLPQYCKDCKWLFACNGGCPKNRVRKSPDGEEGLNYLCKSYQAFFDYVDKPMRIMADLIRQRRAPAEIMGMVREHPGEILKPIPESVKAPKSKRRRH